MAQNEYDVDIKLNLEDSVSSLSTRLDNIDKKIEAKIISWQKEFSKLKTPDKGTEQDYIGSKMKTDQTYLDLSAKKKSYTKGLEAATALKTKMNGINTGDTQKELLTLVDNMMYIEELLPVLKQARIKSVELAKVVKLAKSEADKMKTAKTVSTPKIVSESKVKTSTVPQTAKKTPAVIVPDDVSDKDSYKEAKGLIDRRKANNLKYGANKTLPAYKETKELIEESERRGHKKYSDEEKQQIFETVMNKSELKKMADSKERSSPIVKGKPYLSKNGYSTFLPQGSADIVMGGYFSSTEGLMPNESLKVNAPKQWAKVSKLTGVDLGNKYGQASLFQLDEYYSNIQAGYKTLRQQLETASDEDKVLINKKLEKLKQAQAIISSTIMEAFGNTDLDSVKNKLIKSLDRKDVLFGSDFDADAPFSKDSLLMSDLRGKLGNKPTDFEMELIDNGNPMKHQYEKEVVQKEERKEATAESEAIAEIETKSKKTMEYLGGQFWEDFAKAVETKGAQGATDLVNSLLAQFKDILNGSYEEGEKGVAHLGASYKDVGQGKEGIVAEPLYKDDGTPYDEYDRDDSLGDSLTEEAQNFSDDSGEAQQKMVSAIRTFTQAILNVVDMAYEDASDKKTRVGLGKLKESLEKRVSGFYDPNEKSVDQNFDESFNRTARLLTAGPMQVKNWKDYADASGISFKQAINRTRQSFTDADGNVNNDKADEFLADVTESQVAYRNFIKTLKDDWSNFDEAIDIALSSDSKETREITAQISTFRSNPEMWERWKSNLRQEITPGARSANTGSGADKVDRAMPVLTTAKNTEPLSPKARFIQGHGLGQAVLGTFGTSDIDEGIERAEARLKSLTEQSEKADEKLNNALETIKEIESNYGSHTTDKGAIVDFDMPLWADKDTTEKDIRKRTNVDINRYTKAQEVVNKQRGGQQEIDYVKTLLNAMYEAKDRRDLSLATQRTPNTEPTKSGSRTLPPAIPQDNRGASASSVTAENNAEALKKEEEQAKQTEQTVITAENKKQEEISETTGKIEEQVQATKQNEEEVKVENTEVAIPAQQSNAEQENSSIYPAVASEHIDGLQQSIDKESQKIQVSKELTEQLIREAEAFNMVKEAVTGESEAMTKATEGETDWAKRVEQIKKELRESAEALKKKKEEEEKSKPKEEPKKEIPKEEKVKNPFSDYSDEEWDELASRPLGSGGEFVSYDSGDAKKETALVSEYLSEYNKKLSYQKKVDSIQAQLNELANDSVKVSQEQIDSLTQQKEAWQLAVDLQDQYMESRNLVAHTVQDDGISRMAIGNTILSNAGMEKLVDKKGIADNSYSAAQYSSNMSAKDKASSEYSKRFKNAIDEQKQYNALLQEEYELTQKMKGSTGDKNTAQGERLATVRELLAAFTEEKTLIDDTGHLLNQNLDVERLIAQVNEDVTLTDEERKAKIAEIGKLFSQQEATLQNFKIQNANNAGNNTVNTNSLISQYLKDIEQRGKLEVERQRASMKGQNLKGTQAIENRAFVGSIDRQISQIDNKWNYDAAQKSLNGQQLTEEEINRLESERGRIIAQNNQKLSNMQSNLSESKTFLEKLTDNFVQSFQQIGNYLMSMFSFQELQRIFTNLVNRTSELDQRMVDLQIASGSSREEIKRMMVDFNNLGKQIGKTTTEIAEAANDWLRAGYEGNEVTQLTESSMNLATLGMISSADATSYLISVLKGWKLEAGDIDNVVDKLVKTDMAAAISAGDLAEAMSRANNSAQIAGSSLDRYIGYLTTMTDVTQKSAASIGESMKTVDLCGFTA